MNQTLKEQASVFQETKRPVYSLNINPLMNSVLLPESLPTKIEHPSSHQPYCDTLNESDIARLIPVSDRISAFHYLQRNSGLKVDLDKDGVYEIDSNFQEDVAESLLVKVAPNIKATIIVRSGSKGFHSQFIEVYADIGSEVVLAVVQDKACGTFISRESFSVSENASIKLAHVDIGADVSLVEQKVFLNGSGSKGMNYSIGLKKGSQLFDCNMESIHKSNSSDSDIDSAVILDGSSKATMRGLVKIEKDAAKSTGYQKQAALLLSEDCAVSAVPDLLIHNHDVKCSHSATISRIGKESLFYVMSRGLDEKTATKMLKEAFIKAHFLKLKDAVSKMLICEMRS